MAKSPLSAERLSPLLSLFKGTNDAFLPFVQSGNDALAQGRVAVVGIDGGILYRTTSFDGWAQA